MRVLVTGGTGTLGHALVPQLLRSNHTPVVYSRDEYKQSLRQKQFPDAEYVIGDVRDPNRLLICLAC